MKKYLFIVFAAVCSFFVRFSSASAISSSMSLLFNGDSSQQLYFDGGRNITVRVFSSTVVPTILDIPRYGFIQVCSDADITSYYSNNDQYLNNINIFDSGIKCTLTSLSTIQYITFNTNWDCGATGTNCVFDNSFVFYQQSSSNYRLLSYGFSDDPLDIDYSSGTIINQNDTIINNQEVINDSLDDIKDMDIDDEYKIDPDDSSYQDYADAEDDLMDKVNGADLSVLEMPIDVNSSNFVWDTITDLFQSHPMIFSSVIAILSIGIIKFALGR